MTREEEIVGDGRAGGGGGGGAGVGLISLGSNQSF